LFQVSVLVQVLKKLIDIGTKVGTAVITIAKATKLIDDNHLNGEKDKAKNTEN
jgi:hypothetical protein